MARLKKEVKIFIVRSLAVFNTPSETSDLVKQEFGIEISRQACESYDPNKRLGQNLSADLKAEFDAARKFFIENPQNIPIANLPYRLQRYQRSLEAVNPRAVDHIAKLLRQAAEDVGGVYTNRKEITGAGGQPLNPAPPVSTDEYLAAREQVKDEY